MKTYSPMLAKETNFEEAKLLIKKGWICEEKKDGIRCLVFYENGKVKIQNRRGDDITNTYPEIQAIKLNCKTAVLDCEFVAVSGNFQDIQKRTHLIKKTDIELRMKLYPVIAVCFDLLYCNGIDLTNKPLKERQEKLAEIVEGHNGVLIRISSLNPSEKEFIEIWELVKKESLEGLMLKDENSVYENGIRSSAWKKLKFVKTMDLEITNYELSRGHKGNVGLTITCLYKNNEIRVGVNGLEDRKQIIETYGVPSQNTSAGASTVKPNKARFPLMAEIKYLNETDNHKLRQPTLKRIYKKEE